MEKNSKKGVDKYPGVETNVADKNKVTPDMVKEDVKELNNNPRNNDVEMPWCLIVLHLRLIWLENKTYSRRLFQSVSGCGCVYRLWKFLAKYNMPAGTAVLLYLE